MHVVKLAHNPQKTSEPAILGHVLSQFYSFTAHLAWLVVEHLEMLHVDLRDKAWAAAP